MLCLVFISVIITVQLLSSSFVVTDKKKASNVQRSLRMFQVKGAYYVENSVQTVAKSEQQINMKTSDRPFVCL